MNEKALGFTSKLVYYTLGFHSLDIDRVTASDKLKA